MADDSFGYTYAGHGYRLRGLSPPNHGRVPGRGRWIDEDQEYIRMLRGPSSTQRRLLPHVFIGQNENRMYNVNQVNQNSPLSISDMDRFVIVEKFQASKREEETQASSSAKSGEDTRKICSICLGEILDGEMQGKIGCGHEFHAVCIKEWMKTSPTCPHCRYNVRAKK